MQIANGLLILSPENQQHKIGFTPAEVLINYHLHKTYANGSPLGDWFIQKGEALTEDAPSKAAEEAYFNQNAGKHIEAKPAIEAKTHKRTNAEEIARLKKKYTGNITRDGVARPAFEAVFGGGAGIKLPETFDEIEADVLIKFHEQPSEGETVVTREVNTRKSDLMGKLRHDVCEIAGALGLKVHHEDTKEAIVNAILAQEQSAVDAAAEEAGKNDGESLLTKSKKELLEIAAGMELDVKPSATKEAILAAIQAADKGEQPPV